MGGRCGGGSLHLAFSAPLAIERGMVTSFSSRIARAALIAAALATTAGCARSTEGKDVAYVARDAYLAGNLRGGSCTGNTARYVGFTHTTDSDTPVGAYLANHYAVGFDASGYVADHPMVGNTVVEFYGGGFDLDGLRDSVVANNTATSSQAIAKGLQTGDTSANGGGRNVVIKGNRFSGCNAGSIVLNQADGCLCEGNVIDHPAGASVADRCQATKPQAHTLPRWDPPARRQSRSRRSGARNLRWASTRLAIQP